MRGLLPSQNCLDFRACWLGKAAQSADNKGNPTPAACLSECGESPPQPSEVLH